MMDSKIIIAAALVSLLAGQPSAFSPAGVTSTFGAPTTSQMRYRTPDTLGIEIIGGSLGLVQPAAPALHVEEHESRLRNLMQEPDVYKYQPVQVRRKLKLSTSAAESRSSEPVRLEPSHLQQRIVDMSSTRRNLEAIAQLDAKLDSPRLIELEGLLA